MARGSHKSRQGSGVSKDATALNGKKATSSPKPQQKKSPPESTARIKLPPLAYGSEAELSQWVLKHLKGDGPAPIFDEDDFYIYDKKRGVWGIVERARISQIVQDFEGNLIGRGEEARHLKINHKNVEGTRSLARDRVMQSNHFADARAGRAFANGFLAIKGDRLVLDKHLPENRARAAYPFDYAPTKPPKRFLSFLKDIFRDDQDRAQRINCVQELGGIAALGIAWRYHRCAVLLSLGGGGRSQLLTILRAAMPEGTVIDIKPQQLADPNRRALLVGKTLNAVDECPRASMFEADWFKQIVDGNPTDASRKYGHPFTFKPIAAHVYAANDLFAAEPTDAFFRRVIVLVFTRQFHKDGTEIIGLGEQIVAAELPAIVSWFMVGAARVLAQGHLTIPESHNVEAKRWRKESDAVSMFMEEYVLASDPRPSKSCDWIQADMLYKNYDQWCKDTNHKPLAHNTFGQRMGAVGLPSQSDGHVRRYPVRSRLKHADDGRHDALTELTIRLRTSGEVRQSKNPMDPPTKLFLDGLDGLSKKKTPSGNKNVLAPIQTEQTATATLGEKSFPVKSVKSVNGSVTTENHSRNSLVKRIQCSSGPSVPPRPPPTSENSSKKAVR